MIPLTLTLRNCRTFHEVELPIPEGLVAILGSNGAGKSTLINAIDVALFGPEGRSLADWYPRDSLSDDPLQITLVFEHGGETYKVRRTFSPKGRGQSKTDLERWYHGSATRIGPYNYSMPSTFTYDEGAWEPLTVESQKATGSEIETLIGLSRYTFRASSFLAQGETGRFCEAAPRERKAILAEIVGLADWDRHLERTRSEKREVEREFDQIAGRIEQAEGELQERSLVEQERDTAQKQVEETTAALETTVAALTTAREALADARARGNQRRNAQEAVQSAEAEVTKLRERIEIARYDIEDMDERLAGRKTLEDAAEMLPELLARREALEAALAQWHERVRLQLRFDELVQAVVTATEKKKGLRARAEEVLAHVGEKRCDRCDQVLGADAAARAAKSYTDEADELEREAGATLQRAEDLRNELEAMPDAPPDDGKLAHKLSQAIRDCEHARVQLAALAEVATQRERAQDDFDKMRAELPERESRAAAAIADLDALGPHDPDANMYAEDEVNRLNLAEQNCRLELSGAQQQVARADAQLERLDKIAADLLGAGVRRDELSGELSVLSNLERACGPNGVPALILENVAIPQIEAEASRILGRLGGPAYAVELRTLREKKTGGISDTLDIVCITHDGDRPYETFSGGERARIALALRLALAQLLASRKGSSTGLLVIDEVEGLDPSGIAAFVSVLEDLRGQVPRIIVVSHQAELRDAFEQSILVENVDGRSQIVSEVHVA